MIIKASVSDMETVKHITLQTIKSIYPHYYPCGAVDFFINHHSDKNIYNDIENDSVYLYYNDINIATGTITIKENEISRFFVLPDYQGNGYGRELLSFAENKIGEKSNTVMLAASLPAKAIYLKKGYSSMEFNYIKTDNGDYLCYDVMIKYI